MTDIETTDNTGDPDFPVLFEGQREDFLEVVQENFGDEGINPIDLDRVSIPAGGSQSWEVPTLEGVQPQAALEGVIVAWQSPRVYWAQDLDETGGGQPPDCSSDEGQIGDGRFGPGSSENPDGLCSECPMNEWGSAGDGRGKACKEMRLLYLLQPGGVLPITVSLPPTSIRPLRQYLLRLASKGVPYYGVVTKLGLNKVTGQFTYSVVEPSFSRFLDDEAKSAAKKYGDDLKAMLESRTRPAEVAGEAYSAGVSENADDA